MRLFDSLFIPCFLAALVLFSSRAIATESAYDRVMKTQTIRCVYAVGAPWISVNPNTGEKSGIMDIQKHRRHAESQKP